MRVVDAERRVEGRGRRPAVDGSARARRETAPARTTGCSPRARSATTTACSFRPRREPRSLDLNRNFPVNWRTEGEQQGAGPFPSSEPEVRTIMDAVSARPNICAYFAHHTFSAVILRPYDDRADDQFPTEDLRVYNELGKHATEITGYKAVSVFHDFRYDPKDVISGAADMWAYEHRGHLRLDDRVLEPAPAGRASPTTTSSTGSPTIRSPTTSRCCAGTTRRSAAAATSPGTRSSIRSSARSSSAAGTGSTSGATRRRS